MYSRGASKPPLQTNEQLSAKSFNFNLVMIMMVVAVVVVAIHNLVLVVAGVAECELRVRYKPLSDVVVFIRTLL